MELTLSSNDVKPGHRSLPLHATRFRHLTAGAKAAVRAAGSGALRSRGGQCYEAMYPPRKASRTTRALIRLAVGLPVMLGGAVAATALFSYLGVRVVAVPGGIVLIDNFAQMAAQIAYGLWGMLIYSALFRK